MRAAYSHGGYGRNQQLREAVTRLYTALLSYGTATEEVTGEVKVANPRRDEGKGWWSQRDSNPCLNSTTTSPFIIDLFNEFIQVRNGCD